MLYSIFRRALFQLDAESAHGMAIRALKWMPGGGKANNDGPLITRLAGLTFPNPLGLAPGFDKDAQVPDAVLGLGFGFMEVGTVTPLPQDGNPRPRLFRLAEDRAVINRMGFNNAGSLTAGLRLRARLGRPGIVGVNIGANKDSTDRIADYAVMMRYMAPLANYITVNISSPNTPGLRALQDRGALEALLDAVLSARSEPDCNVPVFLKLAPDLEPADIDDIVAVAMDRRLDALIVSNTTITRPPLASRHAGEAGGLSGAPLRDLALQRLRDFRTASGGAIPLIGVGGIANAADAWERIKAGASLVQLYSAMVYEGPGIARAITKGLEQRMRQEGFGSIAEAVGAQAP